jgi:hypothetical protein
MRFVVIDRRITQGTRGEKGRQWCERIWTTIATCAQQGRSAFEFLHQTITVCIHGQPNPRYSRWDRERLRFQNGNTKCLPVLTPRVRVNGRSFESWLSSMILACINRH